MLFFHSLPVPQFRELFFSIPFLFPNFGNGIIHSHSRSRTPKCHSHSPLPSGNPEAILFSRTRPILLNSYVHSDDFGQRSCNRVLGFATQLQNLEYQNQSPSPTLSAQVQNLSRILGGGGVLGDQFYHQRHPKPISTIRKIIFTLYLTTQNNDIFAQKK